MQENGSHEPSAKGWSQSGQEGKANVNMVAHDIQKTAERREPGCSPAAPRSDCTGSLAGSAHTFAQPQPQGNSGARQTEWLFFRYVMN